jgi:predicted amidohydrolase
MQNLRVAAVQFQHAAGDKKKNLATIRRFVAQAAAREVQLIAFPECCISGYWHLRNLSRDELEDLAEPLFDGASSHTLMELSREHGMTIGAGLVEKDERGRLYNSYLVAMPNGRFARHRKLHVFVSEHITAGDEYTVFDTPHGCRVGVLICYDNNIIENARITALMGAEVLLAPHQTGGCASGSPHGMSRIDGELWEHRAANPEALAAEFRGDKGRGWLMRWLPSRAHDNGMFLVFSNGVGRDDNEVRTGNAMILDPYGRTLAESFALEDDVGGKNRHHAAVDVGQAEVAAAVVVGQAGVVDAQQVQDRGVQVVDVDAVLDGVHAQLVGGAVHQAARTPPPASSIEKPVWWWSRPAWPFCLGLGRRACGRTRRPRHQRVFQQAALLQIGQQRRGGAVAVGAQLAVPSSLFWACVSQGCLLLFDVVDLHEPHAALASRRASRHFGRSWSAVHRADGLRLAADVERLGWPRAAWRRPVPWRGSALQRVVLAAPLGVQAVELGQQIELLAARRGERGWRRLATSFSTCRSLVSTESPDARRAGRSSTTAAARRPAARGRATNAGRFRSRSPAVGDPRAERRPDRLLVAGVHEQQARLVIGHVGVHRADDAQVVGTAGEVREQLAHHHAALAVRRRT